MASFCFLSFVIAENCEELRNVGYIYLHAKEHYIRDVIGRGAFLKKKKEFN
jgi:hypothetical protein